MLTLGINAAYHDPAACVVRDGEVIAAAEDERFTHIKHGKRPVPFSAYQLPFYAIDYCLREADVDLSDIDHLGYSYDPFLFLNGQAKERVLTLPLQPDEHPVPEGWETPWDPLFASSIINAPRFLIDDVPHHLQSRFSGARVGGHFRWHFVPHHIAHAASAFLPSPFERAAILTLDGRGERATTAYALGEGTSIDSLGEVNMPHSLGILYEEVTSYLGFLRSSDEYKVMALASYGRPVYVADFRDIVRTGPSGSFVVRDLRLEERFGPPRRRGEAVEQRHYDIAHSLQLVLEETVLEIAHWLHEKTGSENLCMAGGVALNCVLNGRLRDRGPFQNIWVQPAAGDAGTALGAALWIDVRERRAKERTYQMSHAYLGPSFTDDDILKFIEWSKLPYRRLNDVAAETADMLARNKVIGWFQGRMEFGPRALGGRSILASPIDPAMQSRLNDIKDREDFRPVAPAVLQDEASRWFIGADESPYMLFVFDVQPGQEDRIPAVRHVDGTARIQTVRRDQNPLYYDLLASFQRRTGVPVLVNTSFNTRGEPIVCTPRDAIECFWTSPLDALVIGPFLLEKHGEAS